MPNLYRPNRTSQWYSVRELSPTSDRSTKFPNPLCWLISTSALRPAPPLVQCPSQPNPYIAM